MTLLAIIAFLLAALPAGLFLANLRLYARAPRLDAHPPEGDAISVLIPARNEERNIRATLESILASRAVRFEVIVLDDHSTDATRAIAEEVRARDSRVRIESAPALPAGWCGKQHACWTLAGLASNPVLVFIDADVRLARDSLARMALFLERSGAALASGVPRQEAGTFSERLLLPLIHFVLLGFLPLHIMRTTRRPEASAGCGQLFIARREAYFSCGGHSRLAGSLHDGIKLPRVFRAAGFKTDLFDATDIATCRMYRTNAETWRGLGKNATEGLAARRTIAPMTLMLLGGQVLPFALLLKIEDLSAVALSLAGAAVALAWLPRFVAAMRFQQPWLSAVLHPIGILALLCIQWHAFVRQSRGKPSQWKGRTYRHNATTQPVSSA